MNRLHVFCILIPITSLAQAMGAIAQQINVAPQEKVAVLTMTRKEFATWVQSEARAVIQQGQRNPTLMEEGVLQRLRADRAVLDSTLPELVRIWVAYETPRGAEYPGPRDAVGLLYPDSRRVIDALLPYAEGNSALEGTLHHEKGHLFLLSQEPAAQVKEYDEALRLLIPLDTKVDVQRMLTWLMKARALAKMRDKEAAEKAYRKILAYPWYLVEDAKVVFKMAGWYQEAEREVIRLNGGNVQALKASTFSERVIERLRPELEAATAVAERNPFLPPISTRPSEMPNSTTSASPAAGIK